MLDAQRVLQYVYVYNNKVESTEQIDAKLVFTDIKILNFRIKFFFLSFNFIYHLKRAFKLFEKLKYKPILGEHEMRNPLRMNLRTRTLTDGLKHEIRQVKICYYLRDLNILSV